MAELIKVSAQSRSTAVAGAIAGVMREQGYAEVQAIGASAVNQAVKAVAIARGNAAGSGRCRSCVRFRLRGARPGQGPNAAASSDAAWHLAAHAPDTFSQ